MSQPETLVANAAALGVRLEVRDKVLHLEGPSPYPSDLIDNFRQHRAEVLGYLSSVGELCNRVAVWAGDDPECWKTVLTVLKRKWDLSKGLDSPRDLLVCWASAHYRRSKANTALKKLSEMRGMRRLTPGEERAERGRKADVDFFGRLARALDSRGPTALALDAEARQRLERVIAVKEKKEDHDHPQR